MCVCVCTLTLVTFSCLFLTSLISWARSLMMDNAAYTMSEEEREGETYSKRERGGGEGKSLTLSSLCPAVFSGNFLRICYRNETESVNVTYAVTAAADKECACIQANVCCMNSIVSSHYNNDTLAASSPSCLFPFH